MEDKQKLIDICFQIGLTIKSSDTLKSMSIEELATWIAKQLRECGYDTEPCGASWGILK
jgi:hypothetical protein